MEYNWTKSICSIEIFKRVKKRVYLNQAESQSLKRSVWPRSDELYLGIEFGSEHEWSSGQWRILSEFLVLGIKPDPPEPSFPCGRKHGMNDVEHRGRSAAGSRMDISLV